MPSPENETHLEYDRRQVVAQMRALAKAYVAVGSRLEEFAKRADEQPEMTFGHAEMALEEALYQRVRSDQTELAKRISRLGYQEGVEKALSDMREGK